MRAKQYRHRGGEEGGFRSRFLGYIANFWRRISVPVVIIPVFPVV